MPGVWQNCITVATDDDLQRKFNGQVKMMAQKGFQSGNRCVAVKFESIGNITVLNGKEQADDPVGQSIEQQFKGRSGILKNGGGEHP